MQVGIAGLDENRRIQLARLGIAGEIKGRIHTSVFGVSGLDRPSKTEVIDPGSFQERDQQLGLLNENGGRLGDRAARSGWQRGVYFASFEYVVSPFANGHPGVINWRKGRESVFGAQDRTIPLFFDSAGYRREITGTAPKWCHQFEHYLSAIELAQPDGYAAWDYPFSREKTLDYLQRMTFVYPRDPRLWPVFSIRWTWDDRAHLNYARLPGWASDNLARRLVPMNRTQRQYKAETREKAVRLALANALVIAKDPDFKWMCETFGQVMLGGMVGCKCPRISRHLFAATLTHLYPDTKFWLLGQANFVVVNGLGMMGLLDRVSTDGTWWLLDSTAERFAIVEDGLITMLDLGKSGTFRKQSFFTTTEMMAANLRSLLAAYNGEWSCPKPEPLPVNLIDEAERIELKRRLQVAQLELGI